MNDLEIVNLYLEKRSYFSLSVYAIIFFNNLLVSS